MMFLIHSYNKRFLRFCQGLSQKLLFYAINNYDMTPKQQQFLNEAQNHYLQGIYDEEEIIEDLKIVNFVKRFFNKLHENKLINVQLLVNHEIIIYNVFEHAWITNYQIKMVKPEHLTYLKTILLYLKKIDINDPRFIDVPVSYDLDYLLQTKSERPSYIKD